MAERPSELDAITEGGRSDADRIEKIGNEVGAATPYATTGLTASRVEDTNDDEVRSLSPTDSDPEYSVATTGGATEVADANAEPEEIRAQIEQTRNDMSETINAIQEKLTVSNLVESVKEEVGEQVSGAYQSAKHALFDGTAKRFGGFMAKVEKNVNQFTEDYAPAVSDAANTVVRTARSNPIPFALIGLGVGMLLWNSRSSSSDRVKSYRYNENYNREDLGYEYDDTELQNFAPRRRSTAKRAYNAVSDTANQAYEGVSGAAGSAYKGVSNAAGSAYHGLTDAANMAYDQAGNLGTQARQAAHWAQDTYEEQLQQNPLAIGAVALALGAIVGLALPSTEIEGQYMGEARENLIQKAQDAAGDVIGKVQQVAGNVIDKAQQAAGDVAQTAQDEAKTQGLTS